MSEIADADPQVLVREKRRQIAQQHRIQREERDVLLPDFPCVLEAVAVDRDAEIPAGIPPCRKIEEIVAVDAPWRRIGRVAEQHDAEEPHQQHAEPRGHENRPHRPRRFRLPHPAERRQRSRHDRRPPPAPVTEREQRRAEDRRSRPRGHRDPAEWRELAKSAGDDHRQAEQDQRQAECIEQTRPQRKSAFIGRGHQARLFSPARDIP